MRRHTFIAALLACAMTGGCADYQFTVNEKVLYRPAPLFVDYQIADAALLQCINQHIEDARITSAEQLTALNCSHAGIEKLDGIETFTGLTHLKLTGNAITDSTALAALPALRELALDANRITTAEPLLPLQTLASLDLRDNEGMDCGAAAILAARPTLELRLPAQCLGNGRVEG
ncbi:MAG: hypothetical protein V2J89_14065 [Halieaceae bacterium]|jgi:hypothetical protein|nr:hypothetical protein [Halieaceae bacterium]